MGYVCRCDGEHVTSRAGRRRVTTVRSGRSTVLVGGIVFRGRRGAEPPAGGAGVQSGGGGIQRAVRVGALADEPLRSAAAVGVLAEGRPLLGGGVEEGAGFFHEGK